MLKMKYLQYLNIISKNIQTVRLVMVKSYCEGKHIKYINSKELNKDKKSESLHFTCDEVVYEVTERENDATVTSRLVKECDRLSVNKPFLRLADGFKLTLDDSEQKVPQDKTLDKTISKLKDILAEPPSDGLPPKEPTKKIVLTRQEPGPVIWGFIPKEWVTFFYPKTGVCGFYTFLFTTGTYLVSKEIYILEHNFYGGLSMAVASWAAVHYVGPPMAKWLDKEIDDYENGWKKNREDSKQELIEGIAHEKYLQFQAEGQLQLVEAKRENVALQYEAEFRKRQMHVYEQVKRILNYQVAVGEAYRKIQQRNMVQYVEAEVRKSVTPEMQSNLIDESIQMLVKELSRNPVLQEKEIEKPKQVPKDDTTGKGDDKGGKDDKNKK